jgi:hypothetical protein
MTNRQRGLGERWLEVRWRGASLTVGQGGERSVGLTADARLVCPLRARLWDPVRSPRSVAGATSPGFRGGRGLLAVALHRARGSRVLPIVLLTKRYELKSSPPHSLPHYRSGGCVFEAPILRGQFRGVGDSQARRSGYTALLRGRCRADARPMQGRYDESRVDSTRRVIWTPLVIAMHFVEQTNA